MSLPLTKRSIATRGLCIVAPLLAYSAPCLANRCYFTLSKPLSDPARFEADCGPPAIAPPGAPSSQLSGDSINLLDQIRVCDPNLPLPCLEPPATKITSSDPSPPKGTLELPPCFPDQKSREWVRIGYANFHRSCFRALRPQDWTKTRRWASQRLRPGQTCRINEFGEEGLNPDGSPYMSGQRGNEPLDWALDFTRRHPRPATTPGPRQSAADSVYKSFESALASADTCLESINPNLASRMRQAMGVEYRNSRGAAPAELYRPSIECAREEAYSCEGDAGACDRMKAQLAPKFNDPSGKGPRKRPHLPGNCARERGGTLAQIDKANLVPGQVASGSPKIQVFNATALSHVGTRMTASLFHEFLHAAGASENQRHNDGPQGGMVPVLDQVYACQALAFKEQFEHLTPSQLMDACDLCAGAKKSELCRARPVSERCGPPRWDERGKIDKGVKAPWSKKELLCAPIKVRLEAMGCRR